MKKIMVLEANTTAGEMIVDTAVKMSLEVVVATQRNVFQKYSTELQNKIDEVVFTDFGKKDQCLKLLERYCVKNHVSGIVTGFEFLTDLAVELATMLDLPTNNINYAEAYRDKYLMYKALRRGKVATAKTIKFQENQMEMTFPVIVKPSNNAGSCNVQLVNNNDEFLTAIKKIKKNNLEFPHNFPLKSSVLVQEVMRGPEFSVETVVQKQRASVICITDKLTTSGNYFAEVGHTLPSCVDNNTAKRIERLAIRAVKALGIENGVAHVEVILTQEGPKIVEVGARLPGDYIPVLVNNALGINEAKLYLQIALGQTINLRVQKHLYAGIRFLQSFDGKPIKYVSLSSTNSKAVLKKYVVKGESVQPSSDNISRLGHVEYTGSCYRTVFYELKKALSAIKIKHEGE